MAERRVLGRGLGALLSEPEIFDAVRWMLDTHQYLIEPSAAVTGSPLLSSTGTTLW